MTKGPSIVFGRTIAVCTEPGNAQAIFFHEVQALEKRHVDEGSPRSGGWRGTQFHL